MKLDRQKYELARARACMGQKDLVDRLESRKEHCRGSAPG